jgi:hypothetical protein
MKVKATGPAQFLIEIDDHVIALEYNRKKHGALLKIGDYSYHIQTIPRGSDLQIELDGIPYLIELEAGGKIKAPSPAIVVSIPVKPGQVVEKGDLLVVLEAMKMEMIVQAPEGGIVKEILVRSGEQVAAGQGLLLMEQAGQENKSVDESGVGEDTGEGSAGIQFTSLINEENNWKIIAWEYYSVFLGYDHDPSVQKIFEKAVVYPKDKEQDQQLARLFIAGIKAYVDIERLFFSPPVASENLSRLTSYRELLSHYFRRQGDREKGLPDKFLTHLQAALQLYFPGKSLDTIGNEEVRHLYLSHNNLVNKQKILKKTLLSLEFLTVSEESLKGLSDLLDELAFLSQNEKFSLSDTAIHTRYQLFDRKVIQQWKEEKRESTGKILERLFRYERTSSIYAKLIDFIMQNKYHLLYDLVRQAEEAVGTEDTERAEGTAGVKDAATSADPGRGGGSGGKENKYHLIMEILSRHMCHDREFLEGSIITINEIDMFYCKTKR